MAKRKLRILLGALAATVLASLGNVAHAGFYDSDFDPFPINGTGFEGQAVFKLTPACETTGVHFNNPFGGFGCTFDMEPGPGTWVKVYDFVNGTKVATANLNFNTIRFPDTRDMFALAYAGGDITAVATYVIGALAAIPVDPNNPNNGYFNGNWYLQFVVTPGFPGENNDYDGDHPPVTFDTNVVLYHGCVNPRTVLGVIIKCNNTDPSTIAVATEVSFAAVPEPATIALMLGGIGAGWLSRRRKAAR